MAKSPQGTDLLRLKRKMAKKFNVSCPSNVELLKTYHKMAARKRVEPSEYIENLLKTRPVRSLSGIVNVSVLVKPYPCPGKCAYCPQEKNAPKSYLKGEPAVMRAILNEYDPYKQVKTRLNSLKMTGHPTDKIMLRIVGGTWSFYPEKYKSGFIKKCFEACNGRKEESLESAFRKNEKAEHRLVGISIETRPDFVTKKEIENLRKLGVTQVELGVQSIYEDVLKLNKRGHGVKETKKATEALKDAGFKICYQMMPNLPGSTLKRDEKMFKELFSNPDFKPDFLKIYPCAVLKNTLLYKWWKRGKYRPYTKKQLISLIKKIKREIPWYVRIQRITRDIPSGEIVAGPAKISNLRQLVSGQCKCIRCREVRGNYDPKEKIFLFRQDYEASKGKEVFLSYENKGRDKLFSLLRLRLTSDNKTFIRHLHTYGKLYPFGPKTQISPQHKGLGKKLVREAEKISQKEFGAKKIAVISGIGVRGYYRKLGYKLNNTYMVKNF